MTQEKVLAIFDIGKTNKKFFLFNQHLEIVYNTKIVFPTLTDDDGFECDDIDSIEIWIDELLNEVIENSDFHLLAVNFSAYGSTMVYVDDTGKRVAPLYSYLKEMPADIPESLYAEFGGKEEFCRVTASPQLGSENCGHHVLWLKKYKPDFFRKTKWALFFAQYLSFRLHKKPIAEITSIGCHTGIWNHDENELHEWAKAHSVAQLIPKIIDTHAFINVQINRKEVDVGVGIHDSSASIVPYLIQLKQPFLLISTGTWCININPFNQNTLTKDELERGCVNYISFLREPVKASKLFLGHIHDSNLIWLSKAYNVNTDYFKKVQPDIIILNRLIINGEIKCLFFDNNVPKNYISNFKPRKYFISFEEAYHQLILELVMMNHKLIELIMTNGPEIKNVYISGGFSGNDLYIKLVATVLSEKDVYISNISNASALGVALISYSAFDSEPKCLDLGLKKVSPLNIQLQKTN